MKISTRFVWTLIALLVLAGGVIAQPANPPAGGISPKLQVDMVGFWNGLIVLLVPVLVQWIKKALPTVPKVAWPLAATLLGVAADWALAKSGMIPNSSWALGALCGAAGVGLREATKQVVTMTGVGVFAPDATNPAPALTPLATIAVAPVQAPAPTGIASIPLPPVKPAKT